MGVQVGAFVVLSSLGVDDLVIDTNSSEEDMLRVLDVIGRGDEFDKIRDFAMRGEVY